MPNIHVLILLVGLLLGRDLARAREGTVAGEPMQFAIASGWCVVLALIALVVLPACARGAASRGSRRLLLQGMRLASWLRWLLVLPFAGWSVATDAIGAVEAWIGPWIVLDEIVAALPPLLALVCISWAEYPLQDRMRQALVMRQLDEGGLPDRLPTRLESTVGVARAMLAMPLVPVTLIVFWHEAVAKVLSDSPGWVAMSIDVAGTMVIVAMAPAVIVRVLGTQRLAEGALHDRVGELRRAMGTRLRGVRLWQHASANAALMGVLPLARYVLVTDRLVRSMPRHELDAVLAHELAHSRQNHVLWILLSVLAAVLVLSLAQPALVMMVPGGTVAEGGSVALATVLVLMWFGAVSRLIERQADAHAAVAIGREIAEAQGGDTGVVHPAGPACMAASLDRVCVLNGIEPSRWGFRHGSVWQRQRALAALPGLAIDRLPVDRRVRLLKWATLLGLLGSGAFLAIGAALGWIR
ncbi:MAG: M48 family metalloprotease [Phycisphaerales bacterium]